MKKLIISGVFCSVLMLGGFQVASAEGTAKTTTSNSAAMEKIQELMKLIADLQAKLNAAKGEVKELVADLEEGAEGDDIKKVQEVLATDPSIFGAKPTGYFGPVTREALKKFQERYGLEVTGKLDEGTREAIMELRKDGVVPPGILKSQEAKDRIKARLQDKWGDCDFTRPVRAALCEKVKDRDKGDKKHDDKDNEDDDDTTATRDDARRAVVDAEKAFNTFRKEVAEMKDDNAPKAELDEAKETLVNAQKELSKAQKAFYKKNFDDAHDAAEEVLEIIQDNDSDDDSDDDDNGDDEDEDTEDDKDDDDNDDEDGD